MASSPSPRLSSPPSPFAIALPKNETRLIIMLIAVYLVTRLPLLGYLPLVMDESLYSIMIFESSQHLTLIPTFLGEAVNWKPTLFFWIYSLFPHLPFSFPIEASFRYPSLIFGLLTIPLIFRILQNAGSGRNIAFFSTLIFIFSLPSLYSNCAILVDTLNFFLISLALFFYTSPFRPHGRWHYLGAGGLVFAAFFVKLSVCFMVPILAVAYYFNKDRNVLKDRIFILSLLAAPLALLTNAWAHQMQGNNLDLAVIIKGENPVSYNIGPQLASIMGSADYLLLGAGIWVSLSFIGILKHWRENKFMALWYSMILFPLLTGYYMVWYYLPIMPAVAFFSALILLRWDGADNMDFFFALFFVVAVVLTLGMIGFFYLSLHDRFSPSREVGSMLAGKENVLVIGSYSPSIIAYKVLIESDVSDRTNDFGWILVNPAKYPAETVNRYIDNYSMDTYPVSSSFSTMFRNNVTIRKNTTISRFNYVAVVGFDAVPPGCRDLLFNDSGIAVFGGCG